MKESFILFTDQKAVIDKLSNEDAGKLFKAIFEYVATDEMPSLEYTLDLVMTPIKTSLDKNREKYDEVSKKRAEAGSKGGKQKVANIANASKCKQDIANVADNDNEYDTDTDNDNVVVDSDDSCVDGRKKSNSCVDGIFAFYENNIGMMTPHIADILESYRADFKNDEIIILALKKAVEANARNINYIKAILNAWHKAGIKTVIEAKQEMKKKGNTNFTQNLNAYRDDPTGQYQDLSRYIIN